MNQNTGRLAGLIACAFLAMPEPGPAAFKRWRVSESDESKYCSAFVALNRSIFTAICRKDKAGRFVEPLFENVDVPEVLSERFAESALKRYFKRVNRDRVRRWMDGLLEAENWTWGVYLRTGVRHSLHSTLRGVPTLSVTIRNQAPLSFRGLTLYLHTLDRAYTLTGAALEPKKTGTFSVKISEDEYKAISGATLKASIRGITW